MRVKILALIEGWGSRFRSDTPIYKNRERAPHPIYSLTQLGRGAQKSDYRVRNSVAAHRAHICLDYNHVPGVRIFENPDYKNIG